MLVVSQRIRKRQPLQEEPRGAAASPWTWLVRGAWIVAGAAAVAAPRVADAAVARCWAYVLSFRIAHHCLFEASLATWGFFQAIAFFQLLDSLGSVSRRWRFDGAAPVPYGRSSDSQRGGLEAGMYIGGVLAFHAVKRKAPLAVEPPTLGRVAGEVAAGIVAYDLLFYWIHRFFHWKGAPSFLRRLHGEHHKRPEPSLGGSALRARETTHHSLADGFLQVACNVLVQQHSVPFFFTSKKHDLSRFLHNIVVTYMLVEIHSGYDAPFSMHNVWPWVFGGARAHEHHHRTGTACYHEFFRYLDVILGSDLASPSKEAR